ncbi:GGDEF domain-containing protein [Desulfosarcina variabilis]|uniref:GGDEF domain-containing protein n=1 Tax=Desulfosarcina variabilis TaxID=2300 RepID=UPI003AFA720B
MIWRPPSTFALSGTACNLPVNRLAGNGVQPVFSILVRCMLRNVDYKRYGSEVSLIMMDIDDFKQVNDSYGHPEGDRVLSEISTLILKTARDLDICSRYGGEEFAVILPQTGHQEALRLAERIRKRVENRFKKDLNVTISLGVATCPRVAKSAEALVSKADKALFQSKKRGKNRVTLS